MPERDPKTGRFPPRPSAPKGGKGWGGEAKGASTSRITADAHGEAIRALRWDKDNAAQKEQVAAQMRHVLYDVALNGDAETARINAADKLLDRIEGKPKQHLEHTVRDVPAEQLTDDELAAIARRSSEAPTSKAPG
jgi:hypothetical protein